MPRVAVQDSSRLSLRIRPEDKALPLPTALLSDLSSQITIEFWAKGGSGHEARHTMSGVLQINSA